MDIKVKADSLSAKMNKLSEKFDLSEELITTGNDVEEYIQEKTCDIELFKEKVPQIEVINLQILVDDFVYIRETLKESTENGRRILNVLTLDLLDENVNNENRASLITSYAEMNTAVDNNMKLYILSYKEISIALLNIDKYKKQNNDDDVTKPNTVNNTFNISTSDLIKSLKG